jgi:Winged helix-turn helix
MAIPVALRGDFKASQLRGLARKAKDGPQARRLLAVAAIYDGATRTEAAKIGGVGLQIIRDWVMRFNARGLQACSTANRQVNPRSSMMCNARRLCR